MPLIGQGGTFRWTASVVDGANIPSDPSVLTLTVKNGVGAIQAGFPVTLPTITHDALGTYHYDWAVPVNLPLGTYYGFWTGVLNGGPIDSNTPDTVDVVDPGDINPIRGTTWTYDPTTDAGKVRLLCQDFDMVAPIFSDAEIAAFMSLNLQDVWFSAATALEVIAANEVYVQKRIQILDLRTDGPQEADRLLALAVSYRKLALATAPIEEMFDYAEEVYDGFSWVARIHNELLRHYNLNA